MQLKLRQIRNRLLCFGGDVCVQNQVISGVHLRGGNDTKMNVKAVCDHPMMS